ncbi:MAG: serpin family protein [bacterium]|nr:serpin family protein [bacterium]
MKKIAAIIFLIFTLASAQTGPQNYLSVVKASNKFSSNFFSEIGKQKGNIFFSPYSIFDAFGMAYEGADGITAIEIRKVFNFPASESDRLNAMLALQTILKTDKRDCELNISNAYWVQEDFYLMKTFTDKIQRYYDCEAKQVNFIKNPADAINKINQWAEKKTKNKIKKFINEGDINQDTRLVLTNAIYFKGIWKIQFDRNTTKLDNFWTEKNKSIKVPMMQLLDKEFPYAETETFQIIKLPYKCGNLSMLILLPKNIDINILETFAIENFEEYQKTLTQQKVDVFIPRFKIESTIDLSQALKKLGIKSAFSPEMADFSKITGNKDLFISKAIQKSYIEVNEEGTEAAAVTGIVMNITSAMPETKKIFRADHPFLFFIIEEKTGLVLFAGRLVQP